MLSSCIPFFHRICTSRHFTKAIKYPFTTSLFQIDNQRLRPEVSTFHPKNHPDKSIRIAAVSEDGKALFLSLFLKGQVDLEKWDAQKSCLLLPHFSYSPSAVLLFLDTAPKSEPQAFTWLDIFIATKMSFSLAKSGWNPRSGIVLMG